MEVFGNAIERDRYKRAVTAAERPSQVVLQWSAGKSGRRVVDRSLMFDIGVSMPQLEARAVSRAFAGGVGVKRASITVDQGEVHALVGLNGAGKTTLMRLVLGMLRPDSGSVMIDGVDVGALASSGSGEPRPPRRDAVRLRQLGHEPPTSGWPHDSELTAPAAVGDMVGAAVARIRPRIVRGTCAPAGSRSETSSGWASRRHCSTTRGSWCSMNPPMHSTRPESSS